MNNIHICRYALLLFLFLGIPSIKTDALTPDHDISKVIPNEETPYISFDKELADIANEISALDPDVNSPIHLFKKHIDTGYVVGLRDEVMKVLEYADWLINQQQNIPEKQSVSQKVNTASKKVARGCCNISKKQARHSGCLQLLKLKKKLLVKGPSIFEKDVTIGGKLCVHGKACFFEEVKFKDDVKFEEDVVFEDDVK